MASSEAYSAIWAACADRITPVALDNTLHRIVESQEQVATSELVGGDLRKQERLEQLIDTSKPEPVEGTGHLDYLLATPWRYPPLKYGSRFGRRDQASLFYGGLGVDVTLAEGAFLRWLFFFDMQTPPAVLQSRHTLFEAPYRCDYGLRLQDPPFDAFESELTHPADYRATQALGALMREQGIEAFEYRSARDPAGGVNVALFTPRALASKRAKNASSWLCTTDARHVRFSYNGRPTRLVSFAVERFTVDGVFPQPA